MTAEKISELLKEKKVDAALVSSPANIRYLSGFAGTESYLYLTPERKVILTDSRYTLQAEEEGKGCEVQTMSRERSYGVMLGELLREDGVERLGFEENAMLYGTWNSLWKKSGFGPEHWVMLGDSLSELRVMKNEQELQWMEKARRPRQACWRRQRASATRHFPIF